MPKTYPETRRTGTTEEGTGFKKTFGVYSAKATSSRAMIIALVIAAILFVLAVIMLVRQ